VVSFSGKKAVIILGRKHTATARPKLPVEAQQSAVGKPWPLVTSLAEPSVGGNRARRVDADTTAH
jgi:hypothetical protein